jgi:hypothetical protein
VGAAGLVVAGVVTGGSPWGAAMLG